MREQRGHVSGSGPSVPSDTVDVNLVVSGVCLDLKINFLTEIDTEWVGEALKKESSKEMFIKLSYLN